MASYKDKIIQLVDQKLQKAAAERQLPRLLAKKQIRKESAEKNYFLAPILLKVCF